MFVQKAIAPFAIALAQADYPWQQGLETDAWATILPLQGESSEVMEAVQMGYDQWCGERSPVLLL